MRGLKLYNGNQERRRTPSHPTRVRGLKQANWQDLANYEKSHPTRVRGLKQKVILTAEAMEVAPHTGAWIET